MELARWVSCVCSRFAYERVWVHKLFWPVTGTFNLLLNILSLLRSRSMPFRTLSLSRSVSFRTKRSYVALCRTKVKRFFGRKKKNLANTRIFIKDIVAHSASYVRSMIIGIFFSLAFTPNISTKAWCTYTHTPINSNVNHLVAVCVSWLFTSITVIEIFVC